MSDAGPQCGILLHQRPMLQNVMDFNDPLEWLFCSTWFETPDEPITDAALADATLTVNGQNLLFLKALVDGRPEIINVEFPAGETMSAARLLGAEPKICVHLTNDPSSGFYCRDARDVRILAPIRSWRVRSEGQVAAGPMYQSA